MPDLADITVVTVNYRTAGLTERCIGTFMAHYPQIKLILVDNGSHDGSTTYIKDLAASHPNVCAILNEANLFHGPALHQGICAGKTRFIFTLDSDCAVKRGGFLERMLGLFDEPSAYAAGMLLRVDRFGFSLPAGMENGIPYVHPFAMLLDREKYARLPPFAHHGAPCFANMRRAARLGFTLHAFPITEYIDHEWRGTAGKYGYGLGPKTYLQSLVSLKLMPALRRLRRP